MTTSSRLDQEQARFRRVDAIFDAVLDMIPLDREAHLARECGGDADLRAEIDRLLAAHAREDGFLSRPALDLAEPLLAELPLPDYAAAELPERVGPFRVIREIGRGGMGIVLLAERDDEQFVQRVAIKFVRQARLSEGLVERLLGERRILAMLDDPRIARLVDGGVTSHGLPYFAMEYVDGEPIDRYCDRHGLAIEARLELFAGVCEAVHYAHRRLVVHRDLKPSNILVTADRQLKLLDFGIAKLLDPLTPSDDTVTAQRAMTPEYAAPEQVLGEAVSTSSDIYALGVLLYTLLAGRRPYEVRGRSAAEIERIVCQLDPPPPSSMVDRGSGDARATAARARGTNPERLRRRLHGDLDAIVLKAMRKEAAARYLSAQELADDLRRYIRGEPVHARLPTRGYVLRRFVRRHRLESMAAVAVAVAVGAGTALSLMQAERARSARDRAESARHVAERASRESEAVTAFLLELFATPSGPAPTESLTVQQLLRLGVQRASQLSGDPQARARMFEVTGRAHANLGEYAEAEALLLRALAIRREDRAAELAIAETLRHLAAVRLSLGRLALADSNAREALSTRRRVIMRPHVDDAKHIDLLARVAIHMGRLADAEAHCREVLAIRQQLLGPEDTLTAHGHLRLGAVLRRRGRFDEAERELSAGATILERALGPQAPDVADASMQLGYLLSIDRGRPQDAEALLRRGLDIRLRSLGAHHPLVAAAYNDLAGVLSMLGRHDEAVDASREHRAILARQYGEHHPWNATAMAHLAIILRDAGEHGEAEELFRAARTLQQRILGPDHPAVAGSAMDYAQLLIARQRLEEAEELVRDAVRIRSTAHGALRTNTLNAVGQLGLVVGLRGDRRTGDSLLNDAIAQATAELSNDHFDVRRLRAWQARLHAVDATRRDSAVAYRVASTW